MADERFHILSLDGGGLKATVAHHFPTVFAYERSRAHRTADAGELLEKMSAPGDILDEFATEDRGTLRDGEIHHSRACPPTGSDLQ